MKRELRAVAIQAGLSNASHHQRLAVAQFAFLSEFNESKNVAAQHADIVKKLSAKAEAWVATLPKEYLKTGDKQD